MRNQNMADLKDLTVPMLEKLAEECGIKLKKSDKKAAKIKKIKNAGIPASTLNSLIDKYLKEKKTKKLNVNEIISELKGRIRLLEEQVKFLMSKINVSEVQITSKDNQKIMTITSNLEDIKKLIVSLIKPGESISIDELIEIKELQKIPLISLKHALFDLIDEGILKASEGKSRQKLGGTIAYLTRTIN